MSASINRSKALSMGPGKPIIMVIYVVGILGNLAAVLYLRTGKRRVNNKKHLLLLTALAANDLAAMVGSICIMLVGEYLPGVQNTKWLCAMRVVMRIFGFGSGCIAATMALERYLAFARPFFYNKNVSYRVVWSALLISWSGSALLTCSPIFGLGLYYSEVKGCLRYRHADSTQDIAYAVTYVISGTLLCVVLVYCNTAVIRELYAIRSVHPKRLVVRRISKSNCQKETAGLSRQPIKTNVATTEEVTFSWIMATMSAFFMICWLPQLLTSALFLALGRTWWPRLARLGLAADVLILAHSVLNPVLYVLLRSRSPLASLRHTLLRCFCFRRKRKLHEVESTRSPACFNMDSQESRDLTAVGSDYSNTEMQPLQNSATTSAECLPA